MRKIRILGYLSVCLDGAAFVEWDVAACSFGPVFDLGAGEVAFDAGVDAGFEGCGGDDGLGRGWKGRRGERGI